eukprot:1568628-Pleurochrysis_carterae.AAC.1
MDVELLVYPQRINSPNERTEGVQYSQIEVQQLAPIVQQMGRRARQSLPLPNASALGASEHAVAKIRR